MRRSSDRGAGVNRPGRRVACIFFYCPYMVDAMEKRYKVKPDEGGQATEAVGKR